MNNLLIDDVRQLTEGTNKITIDQLLKIENVEFYILGDRVKIKRGNLYLNLKVV